MRTLIITAGSRGDVDPYTGLGGRLVDAGHKVTLATHGCFGDLVTGAGLDFSPLPGDPLALLGSDAFRRWQRAGSTKFSFPRQATESATVMREMSRFWIDVGAGIADVVHENADVVLLSNTVAPLGYHLCAHLGIPSMGVYWGPVHPTAEFPPMLGGGRSMGRLGNRAIGSLVGNVVERAYPRAIAHQRKALGLGPTTPAAQRRHQDRLRWPVCYGYSPSVLPRPRDWREGLDVVGYWWPREQQGWHPPERLVDFLAAGPPPVFVGFGSLAATDSERLSRLTVSALRMAGERGVVQSGWADLCTTDEDVLTIDDVPYEWLFPQMRAVVHRAGSGTTAAGLRAGVPAVSVPWMIDQYFWSARLFALGVGPRPIPFQDLTAVRLADAIRAVTSEPGYTAKAQAVRGRLATEDGAAGVLDVLGGLVR